MVALKDAVVWSLEEDLGKNVEQARRSKHTRYPVYDPRLDDLVGVINLKALALMSDRDAEHMRASDIIKELLRVPEGRRIDAVLKEMRRRRLHMAAVIDRAGKAIGILTMEDIIEEIFGEIEDEFETAKADTPGDR
jgi:CBS domain containing-hemolysin-like protein